MKIVWIETLGNLIIFIPFEFHEWASKKEKRNPFLFGTLKILEKKFLRFFFEKEKFHLISKSFLLSKWKFLSTKKIFLFDFFLQFGNEFLSVSSKTNLLKKKYEKFFSLKKINFFDGNFILLNSFPKTKLLLPKSEN